MKKSVLLIGAVCSFLGGNLANAMGKRLDLAHLLFMATQTFEKGPNFFSQPSKERITVSAPRPKSDSDKPFAIPEDSGKKMRQNLQRESEWYALLEKVKFQVESKQMSVEVGIEQLKQMSIAKEQGSESDAQRRIKFESVYARFREYSQKSYIEYRRKEFETRQSNQSFDTDRLLL